ncbi:nucleotidyltransferase family protein [Saccharothrix yanglingensis]|uniref:nucleotidyltransferase family protein n=1 Tax=Saccharothrix yanglingensis TaxID=659496 RepID=UPI00352911E5
MATEGVTSVHEVIAAKRSEVEDVCRALGVRRLDVFGSAVGDSFDVVAGDVDVLVEFDAGPGFGYFGSYFALEDGLERIFGRPADLVSAAGIRNPYPRQRMMETGNSCTGPDPRTPGRVARRGAAEPVRRGLRPPERRSRNPIGRPDLRLRSFVRTSRRVGDLLTRS